MKVCIKCGCRLEARDFHRRSASKDGRQAICFICTAENDSLRRRTNSKHIRKQQRGYYLKNQARITALSRCAYWKNPEGERLRVKTYIKTNRSSRSEYNRLYRKANPAKVQLWKQRKNLRRSTKQLGGVA